MFAEADVVLKEELHDGPFVFAVGESPGFAAEFFGFGVHDEVGYSAVLTASSPLGYS